jgi:hypothetical protein
MERNEEKHETNGRKRERGREGEKERIYVISSSLPLSLSSSLSLPSVCFILLLTPFPAQLKPQQHVQNNENGIDRAPRFD